MTLNEFRTVLLTVSVGRTALPEDTILKERIFKGLKMIAKETIPLKLLLTNSTGAKIIRRLDDALFIRFPRRPIEEDLDLDIDEELVDALAYLVMAGLERAHKKQHMSDYLREKDMNNDRLIETYLSESTNESDNMQPYV